MSAYNFTPKGAFFINYKEPDRGNRRPYNFALLPHYRFSRYNHTDGNQRLARQSQ